jgi:hypothetical protein
MAPTARSTSSTSSVLSSPSQLAHGTSPFSEALSEFVKGFGKKRKLSFVQDYLNGTVVNANDVQITLKDMEKTTSHKQVSAFLEPIVLAMVDYTGVLDTLCSFFQIMSRNSI